MSVVDLIKKLIRRSAPEAPRPAPEEAYKGFTIRATPYREAGQFQMCGVISKEIDGAVKDHRFVRADRFSGEEEAVTFTFQKARQIIDMNGTKIFS